jgi:hypothetical protein
MHPGAKLNFQLKVNFGGTCSPSIQKSEASERAKPLGVFFRYGRFTPSLCIEKIYMAFFISLFNKDEQRAYIK